MQPGSRRARALAVLLAALVAAGAAGSWTAVAQDAPGLPIGGSSTTTTSKPKSTTTTAKPATSSTTTTTTAPEGPTIVTSPSQSTSTTTTTTTTRPGQPPSDDGPPPPPASPETGDGGVAPPDAGAFPPELQALTNSVGRTRANNTKMLLLALAPLRALGIDDTRAAVVGFGRFPVAGLASYSHDWWYPRFGPGWRLHEGTDIFAAYGTPVRAPVDGTVRITNGGLGGLSVYVVQPDRTYWYLTHLAGLGEGIAEGVAVKTGQVVGYVGDSGNARGGPPHLHFEVHPGGGGPIDPKPVLDQFIADAIGLAPRVVDAYRRAAAAGTSANVVVPSTPAPAEVVPALSPRAALLWTTSVSPTGGALQLAEAEAARVASKIDWSRADDDAGVSVFQRQMARRYAFWWVEPLAHPFFARHLSVD